MYIHQSICSFQNIFSIGQTSLELLIAENIRVRSSTNDACQSILLVLSSIVWNYGEIASDGLKQVAEWGAIGTMQKEIKNHVSVWLFDT